MPDKPRKTHGTSRGGSLPTQDAPDFSPYLDPPQAGDELGRLGQFIVRRVLGYGGMGIVFEAEDPGLQRRVAIKVLRPDMADEDLSRRFLREARVAASLKNDHVVTIYQVGEHDRCPFLVMELLKGESLADRLERDGWLPVAETLDVARQVAEGLRAAHAAGLVHRDIKPANIWLECDKPGGPIRRVKILDFGLAKPVHHDDSLTGHGQIVGTPHYMAPEQIFGGELDGRTDLFALGCVLYRCLTGRNPFAREHTTAVLRAAAEEELTAIEDSSPQIPRSVADYIRQLLSKDPAQRPPSAAAVAERLRALGSADSVAFSGVTPKPDKTLVVPAHAHRRKVGWGVWAGAGMIVTAALIGLVALIVRCVGPVEEPTEDDGRGAEAGPAFVGEPLKIGVLHSLTGTFSASERAMVNAILLAVEEINQAGGVLRRKVEPVVKDPHSDDQLAAALAEKMITEDRVVAVFGCWSSSARKSVLDVVKRRDHLLIFSSIYEGLEDSPFVVYIGGAPNQQLQPAIRYAYSDLQRRKFFLVGSDYVYSRAAHQILRDEAEKLNAQIVGEEYVPLEGTAFAEVVRKVKESGADMVMNTTDGTSNIAFFQAMRAGRIKPRDVPTMWLGIGEEEIMAMAVKEMVGDYAASPYFQSIDNPVNEAFLKRYRARYPYRRVSDATEASYNAVYLWKQAVEAAKSADPPRVREAFKGQSLDAPEGRVRIDPKNLHAWRSARIAHINADLKFEVEYTTPRPLAPEPFPATRTRRQWEAYLNGLYEGWGGRWEGPRR
jgi:urea transport system substrate-binding protein